MMSAPAPLTADRSAVRGSPARSRRRSRADWPLLRDFGQSLGIAGATSYAVKGWGTRGRWRTISGSPPLSLFASAFTDSQTKLDARGLSRCAFVALDFDAHDLRLDLFAAVGPARMTTRQRNRATRAAIAELFRPTIEALRRTFPGLVFLYESTGRGLHVIVKLARPIPANECASVAATLASGIEGELPEGTNVEAFPKIDRAGTGRTCALPLCGPSRLVTDDLCTIAGRTRADGLRAFVAAPCATAAQIAELLGREPQSKPETKARIGHVAIRGSIRGERYAQTRGANFARECERLLDDGIADDESWNGGAVQKLAFMSIVLGFDDATAESAFGQYIEQPIHDATHAQAERGRDDLRRTFRSCLTRYQGAVAAGELQAGKMKSYDLKRRWMSLAACGVDPGSSERTAGATKPKRARTIEWPGASAERRARLAADRRERMRGVWQRRHGECGIINEGETWATDLDDTLARRVANSCCPNSAPRSTAKTRPCGSSECKTRAATSRACASNSPGRCSTTWPTTTATNSRARPACSDSATHPTDPTIEPARGPAAAARTARNPAIPRPGFRLVSSADRSAAARPACFPGRSSLVRSGYLPDAARTALAQGRV
jgi:hypothetical protein